ncbi:MAG TPA: biosynthetic peptidoglycan transglycosylase, partial [Flavobacteriales bacterium]|nr:biosynthetic peptidoglycan transglycosylase [Flavobacteriales bacterium]
STLTMQVARMALGDRPRTVWNKLCEMVLAVRLELRFSKDEILALYAANAPFGGNVVGSEAAAWRWFGRAPHQLGWAECATLAVLPNAPARIHPGKARD